MVLDFLLPQSYLNLFFLSTQQKKDLAKSNISFEAATYFEYKKTKGGYQTGEHLLNQIIKKALPIREALYPNYILLFLFDNTTSYSIYAPDILQIAQMNKGSEGQKSYFRPEQFVSPNQKMVIQEMLMVITDPITNKSTII